MPREIITLQVGQCGNQIGLRFWDLALREHAHHNKSGVFDESMSSFFRNVDSRFADPPDIPVGDGTGVIRSLRARAILVDMEEGVVREALRSPLGEIFDAKQFLTDVSGSGNNWAQGHLEYGPQYRDRLLHTVRRAAEACDSLQAFFLMHSLGGGTGSGFGTYLLGCLADEYPGVFRLTTSIFPSEDDDVVTSPYNSVFSLQKLIEFADCVLPIENQALIDITTRLSLHSDRHRTAVTDTGRAAKPFDAMNSIAAHLLLNLTSSQRFPGMLNVDLNEVATNLVPFPRMHFLVSAMAPLATLRDVRVQPRSIDQMFADVFSNDFQLIRANARQSTYLAIALLVRGRMQVSDVSRNIAKLKATVQLPWWSPDPFKTGVCSVAPQGQPHSVLCLANNCCVADTFDGMLSRFALLYRRRAHVHHYSQFGLEDDHFREARSVVRDVVADYRTVDRSEPSAPPRRFPLA